jgi:hypothetical protein
LRTLTVSSLWRPPRQDNVVPSIRLNGKWLAALGIRPGQRVRVVTNGSIITIAPVQLDDELRYYGKD